MGLDGLEQGLRVGEDMQLRERLNVQETVTSNTWREEVLHEESTLRHMIIDFFASEALQC